MVSVLKKSGIGDIVEGDWCQGGPPVEVTFKLSPEKEKGPVMPRCAGRAAQVGGSETAKAPTRR